MDAPPDTTYERLANMPRTNKSGLTPAVIQEWRNKINPATQKHYTNSEIARVFGVDRTYINWIIRTYGGVTLTPREQAKTMFPWVVPTEYGKSTPPMRLRDHLEYMVSMGKNMPERKLTLLRGFYKKLQDEGLVVEYDPNIPPSDGIFTGAWAYRKREEKDGDLLIRLNEHARELSAEELVIWEFPARMP